MRIRVSCEMVRIFFTPRRPKNAIATTASGAVPIIRLLERIFIGQFYGQSRLGERSAGRFNPMGPASLRASRLQPSGPVSYFFLLLLTICCVLFFVVVV